MPRRTVFRRYGEVDVLETESFPAPPLAPHQLRVAVAFAGVNFADVIARRGFYKWAPPPPTCVGFEVAGTVIEIGSAVRRFARGDRVLAITRFGGYSDEVCIDEARAFPVPKGATLEQAAALPAVTITAWHSLCEVARLREGESVLIQAVAGGVGVAALQIAKHLGLTTYGTASSEAKLTFAREHGLDHGIDYVRGDFEQEVLRLTEGRGVDCVLDSLGGAGLRKGYRCVAPGGTLVTIGAAQVAPRSRSPRALLAAAAELVRGGLFHPFQLIEHNRAIAGVQVLLLWDDLPRIRRGMAAISSLFETGALRPHIDRVFPLEQARAAHALLESRGSRGKLLLRCAAA